MSTKFLGVPYDTSMLDVLGARSTRYHDDDTLVLITSKEELDAAIREPDCAIYLEVDTASLWIVPAETLGNPMAMYVLDNLPSNISVFYVNVWNRLEKGIQEKLARSQSTDTPNALAKRALVALGGDLSVSYGEVGEEISTMEALNLLQNRIHADKYRVLLCAGWKYYEIAPCVTTRNRDELQRRIELIKSVYDLPLRVLM